MEEVDVVDGGSAGDGLGGDDTAGGLREARGRSGARAERRGGRPPAGRGCRWTYRDALPRLAQLRPYGVAALAIVATTTIDLLERIFGTTELDGRQWGICIALATSLLAAEEIIKLFLRRRTASGVLPGPPLAPAVAG